MSKLDRGLSIAETLRLGVRRLPEVGQCRRQFRNWLDYTRRYAGFGQSSLPFTAYGRDGFSLEHCEPADLATTWQIFCAHSYRVPRGAPLVLDLGANVGAFSIFAACVARAQRVIALEPVSNTFARLAANLRRNGLLERVELQQRGIAGAPGVRTLDLGSASVHACMYPRNDPRYESGKTEQIRVTSLDALLRDVDVDEVDMCKMDCEGGEVEALMAAQDETLARIRTLSIEYHFYNAATRAADEE